MSGNLFVFLFFLFLLFLLFFLRRVSFSPVRGEISSNAIRSELPASVEKTAAWECSTNVHAAGGVDESARTAWQESGHAYCIAHDIRRDSIDAGVNLPQSSVTASDGKLFLVTPEASGGRRI